MAQSDLNSKESNKFCLCYLIEPGVPVVQENTGNGSCCLDCCLMGEVRTDSTEFPKMIIACAADIGK